MMRYIFSNEKNIKLLRERNIGFEEVIYLIKNGHIVASKLHPNQEKYPGQKVYVVEVRGYCYIVPFVKDGENIFLKTIIPSRKETKVYLKGRQNDKEN